MKFKVGDRVKFTRKSLARIMKHGSVKKMRNAGVVICGCSRYTKVDFLHSQRIWWINNRFLELIIKNQQLLFSFMER